MKSPIETFSEWVKNGKDDGMEKNHYEPVSKIIELINSTENNFNIIDAGCGNGWAVRLVANEKNCICRTVHQREPSCPRGQQARAMWRPESKSADLP